MEASKLKSYYRREGELSHKAPRWMKVRTSMQANFPSYSSTRHDPFADEIATAVRHLNDLKPKKDGPTHLGDDSSVPDYTEVTMVDLNSNPDPLCNVVTDCIDLFNGLGNWSHPMTMPNVIPPANKAAIIATTLTSLFNPNAIEGEFSWNVQKAEMESATIVAKQIGWDPEVAGGIYTYGGSGCYLYGMKYALTQVFGTNSRFTGIREDGKILVSQQGHYAKMNSTDWTGLGMNNIVEIEADDDTNEMDLHDLEKKLKHFHEQKIPVVSIICTMGTTDAFAIDNVEEIRRLAEEYPNPDGYGDIFIYCDAVVGWSWLFFRHYDFEKNELQFSSKVLESIKKNLNRISTIQYADGVAIDFHKTGWATYNCSMFCMKDLHHFKSLMNRPGSAYLQERTGYNPGLYTLEVSRTASYALAGWATLKYLGIEGFQSILGSILEIQNYLRNLIKEEKSIVCVNEEDNGFVTLFRIYRPDVDAEAQYEKEVSDPDYLLQLTKNNDFQKRVSDMLWKWLRSGEKRNGMFAPYIGFTSGFRTSDYNDDFTDDSVVYALKCFPMNLNITAFDLERLLEMVKHARDMVLEGVSTDVKGHDLVGPPYDKPLPVVAYEEQK